MADKLNKLYSKVQEEMNKLSRKNIVASGEGFRYEYMGHQSEKKS